ncbi:hypothetical protein [Aggregatilinea lenta]|uniref:hypothetical protein n=1 Tax=Aggregatilinea lenta TaxID=913108 RepID=UPI000E5BD585|nr:hypothetical protein [Aggregatilinea lenta]
MDVVNLPVGTFSFKWWGKDDERHYPNDSLAWLNAAAEAAQGMDFDDLYPGMVAEQRRHIGEQLQAIHDLQAIKTSLETQLLLTRQELERLRAK